MRQKQQRERQEGMASERLIFSQSVIWPFEETVVRLVAKFNGLSLAKLAVLAERKNAASRSHQNGCVDYTPKIDLS